MRGLFYMRSPYGREGILSGSVIGVFVMMDGLEEVISFLGSWVLQS